MDFTPTDGQNDAAQLAARILGDRCTPDRLSEVEKTGGRFDRALWQELGSAGLLGLPLPEEHGGAGLGILELTSVLEEIGKVVAPLPLAGHAVAAMAIAEFADDQVKSAWLPAAASGESVLACAIAEDHGAFPDPPATTAARQADGWALTGSKTAVVAGDAAAQFLVTASTDEGPAVFLVDPSDPGITVDTQQVTGAERAARLELEGVALADDRRLGGAEAATWLADHLSVALAAEQLGVCAGGLQLTADYAKTREQFGRPIGSFQAVSQRLADCYIDVRGFRLVLTQAAWRLSEGLPAGIEVATARLWAADSGHTVAHATVHVHGGVGIDLDGAAHRYFTAGKRLEFALGGTTLAAREVGRSLAADPA